MCCGEEKVQSMNNVIKGGLAHTVLGVKAWDISCPKQLEKASVEGRDMALLLASKQEFVDIICYHIFSRLETGRGKSHGRYKSQ